MNYPKLLLILSSFILVSNSSAQVRLSKKELQQAAIDSVFDQAEITGLNPAQKLKYIYLFSARSRIPIMELAQDLEKDTIEVISMYQSGNTWHLSAFKNEILSRQSMIDRETDMRWRGFKFKVDDYLGFRILPADIDIAAVPNDLFFPFILSLEDQDLFNVAIRLDKIKDHPKSLLAFQELVERNFNPDTSYFKLGSALVATHEYVEGIERWEKAVELNPDYLESHMQLGIIYYENSHWKQAHAHFKEAERIKPNDDVILYHLARSLIKVERYNEAYTTIRRALKLNPKNEFAKGVFKSLKSPAIKKLRKKFPTK